MCSHFDRVQRLPPDAIEGREEEKKKKKKKGGVIVFKIAGCPSNMERGVKKREIIGRHFRPSTGRAHPEIYIGRARLGAGGDAY